TPADAWIWLTSSATRMGSIRIAERKVEDGTTPAWMYLFEWRSPAAGGRVRAAHGLDTPFMFGSAAAITATSASDEPALPQARSSAWLAFAREGEPRTDKQPWPAYSLDARDTMVFDARSDAVGDPYAEERELWDRLGVDGMARL